MNDLQRVREILARAAGVNDNGQAQRDQNGHGVTYNFHAPVTFNLFSSPPARAEAGPPTQTAARSALAGQALLSPAKIRSALAALPPARQA